MRTLLIDNYDSFTFNLFQYLAEVNGCAPAVVPNDWKSFTIDKIMEFDNIVISPGPGTPEAPTDFGICSTVIKNSEIPILGVCLGHQGIAYCHGGEVTHAPEPMHGRSSRIWHSGEGLFEGIPTPFQAIRYHSLAVTKVPDDLEVTARSDDGLVMALQHTLRPQWGVQFHPESIGTEHSLQLLSNFLRLTQEHKRCPVFIPHFPKNGHSSQASHEPPKTALSFDICVDTAPLSCSDERLFTTIYSEEEYAVWLDGNQPGNNSSRFSIIGAPTGPYARIATADSAAGIVKVTDTCGNTEIYTSGFFEWLENAMSSVDVRRPSLPFDFALGWVGYLGYELKSEVGSPNRHQTPIPDALVMFLDRALVIDHLTNIIYILSLTLRESAHDDHKDWIAWIKEKIPYGDIRPIRVDDTPDTKLTIRHSHAAYLKLIGEAQRKISDGESYEICLTNMLSGKSSMNPIDTYLLLRAENPAPFGAFLRTLEVQVLSTSPERFMRISGDRGVESKPIKGTRPRGRTEHEDTEIRDELQRAEKDRAENLMIVDLVRHDLGRTAKLGTVRVDSLFDIESYATVHQLVSTIRSELSPGVAPSACVKAAFPPGSMTGAPKLRTMQIIDELEDGPRGVYSGAIGYFSVTGAVDLSVVIRTLVFSNDTLHYGVGGAITALSDDEDEYDETVVKASPLINLLRDTAFPDGHASTHHRDGIPS